MKLYQFLAVCDGTEFLTLKQNGKTYYYGMARECGQMGQCEILSIYTQNEQIVLETN